MIRKKLGDIIIKNRNIFLLFVQLGIILASYYLSFLLRFEFAIPEFYIKLFYSSLPFVILSRLSGYYFYKIHLGSWRFVSIEDLYDTIKAVGMGSILFVIFMVFVHSIEEYPRSVFILDTLLNITFIGGSRFIIRYYHEHSGEGKTKVLKNVLIAGAGKAGVLLLKEIRNNPRLGLRVMGFIDDNPMKKGIRYNGVSVVGNTADIPSLIKSLGIDEVYIAMPSAKFRTIAQIKETVEKEGVDVKVLPEVGRALQRSDFSGYLQDVECSTLLGRKAIKFTRQSDYILMEREISGKVVLVTGAGGSIGSELCRQVAQFRPDLLIMYDRYENTLYDLEIELRHNYPDQKLVPVIGDILDSRKVASVMKSYNVSLLYHAAAYKHVPLMEREPIEAVRNNVLGTYNLASLSVENNLEKFVLISTDKAVNPANIMGATKRIAELIIQSMNGQSRNGDHTKFIAVRFGNVIGSNGSVIPLFKKQIASGGPITITHPEITRYFMSIPEAVQLVMTAGAMGKGGEIFLLDMGEPIKILDIAKELIRKSGLEPGEDIEIQFVGLRPGEKLHEELYWKGEGIVPTDNKKITMLKPNGGSRISLDGSIDRLRENVNKGDVNEILKGIKSLVPEATLKLN
jgi:FlaA1/EpsC-like NDP-sugar epimerase